VTVFVDVVDLAHGTKPNLTVLHGWGLNGQVWNGVRDALAQHFTLHIIDMPGHGKSSGASVTTLSTREAFVEAIAHAMPARGHVMGWSLGGHTALALAAAHPQRVEKLITICCTPRFIASDDWPQGKAAPVLADFAKRLSTNYAATIRNFLALQALSQPEMRDVIKTLYEAVHAHGAPSVESLSAALEILKTSDIRAVIPAIAQPTLVVQGDHDALTSTASAEWLANALPNSTYCLMAHAAHAPFISHRTAFLDHVLGFLQP
jgi:pimeloyl-[acyl-carrier protein] methyl ester esterase